MINLAKADLKNIETFINIEKPDKDPKLDIETDDYDSSKIETCISHFTL